MKQKSSRVEDTLPVKLKLQLLQAELEQIDSDLHYLHEQRQQVLKEIRDCEDFLHTMRSRRLRRVK